MTVAVTTVTPHCNLAALFFKRTRCHCWGRSCRLDVSSYPSPELMNSALHGRNGPMQLNQRKGQKFGLVDQAGGHHDAGARRRHWSHQGRSQARAS